MKRERQCEILNKERDVTDILKDCRNVLSNFLRMSV